MAQLQASTVAGTLTTTGNVGIGTNSPSTPLGGAFGLALNGSSNNDVQIRLQNSTTGNTGTDGGLLSISGTLMYLWNYESSTLLFGTSNTERMRITSDGNVGIGATNPGAKLEVAGVTTFDDGIKISGNTVNGVGLGLNNANGNSWYLISTGTGNGGGANNLGFYNATQGEYRVYFTGGGNVGIGTVSPEQKLDVRGTIYSVNSGTDGGQIRVQNSGGGNAWYWAARTTGLNLGQLGVADARIFVDNGGNVGISTTDPSVGGTVGSKFTIIQSDNSTAIAIYAGTSRRFAINPIGNGGFTLFDGGSATFNAGITQVNGNVGIGITNPARTLNISSAGTSGTQVQINGTADSAGIKFIPASGDNYEVQANNSSQWFVYNRTDEAYRLLIDGAGNVGIGTQTPATKLDITGTLGFTVGSTSAIIRRTTVNGSNGIIIQGNANDTISDTNAGARVFIGGGVIGDTFEGNIELVAYGSIADENRNTIRFYNRSGVNTVTERMRINYLGNVGIGTASPNKRFTVVSPNNDVTTFAGFYAANVSQAVEIWYGGIQMGGTNPSVALSLASKGAESIILNTNSSEKMRIISDGNVGIGTDRPHAQLHINSGGSYVNTDSNNRLFIAHTGSPYILFSSPDERDNGIHFHNTTDNVFVGRIAYYHRAAGDAMWFRVGTNSGDGQMVLISSGNVGIGTASPSRKLEVVEGSVQIIANFQNTSTTSARIKFTDANTGAENVNIGAIGTRLAMWTNNTERMSIVSGGNVGIGTASPQAGVGLEVRTGNGGIQGNALYFYGSGVAPGDGLPYARLTESYGIRFSSPDSTWVLSTAGSFLIGTSPAGQNWGSGNLIASGNAGIGTTSTAYRLFVNGTLRVDSSTSFGTEYGAVPNAIIGNKQDEKCLGNPDEWLAINVSGTDYAVPLFSLG